VLKRDELVVGIAAAPNENKQSVPTLRCRRRYVGLDDVGGEDMDSLHQKTLRPLVRAERQDFGFTAAFSFRTFMIGLGGWDVEILQAVQCDAVV
jgi:hypothetical protein